MLSILSYNIHGLPWSRDNTRPIATWSATCGADCLCFQEVFTEDRKMVLQTILESNGYTVLFPNDTTNIVLSSGLCIAIRKQSDWTIRSSRFTPFLHYGGWDMFANKGFFRLTLQHRSGYICQLINTHMQSDLEIPFYKETIYTCPIRFHQLDQIVQEYGGSTLPTLIIGDLNQEGIIHPSVKNICCNHTDAITTFPPTSENIDHVAWIVGTGDPFRLHSIHIGDEVPWSDHSPLLCTFKLPIA